MPNLIKGTNANLIWKDSVTLETKLTAPPPPPKDPISPVAKEAEEQKAAQEHAKLRLMEETVKARLEEEYRKKTEGLEARYRLLIGKAEKERTALVEMAKTQASALLQEAGEHSQKILDMAKSEYEQHKERATQEGFAHGMEMAEDHWNKQINILKNTIDGLVAYEQHILEKSKADVAQLAVDIFKKITGMGIEPNDEILENMIVEQLRTFKDYKRVRIYLAGYNTYVDTLADRLIENRLLECREFLTVETIDEAEPGTCIIETENSMADISISTQLNNLIKNVRNIAVAAGDEENDEEY